MRDASTENKFALGELEFGRVIEKLSGACSSEQGQQTVLRIGVLDQLEDIQILQAQYRLISQRLESGSKLDLAGGTIVPLPDLFLEDDYLDPPQLVYLHRNYQILNNIRRFSSGLDVLEARIPELPELSDWDHLMQRAFDTDGSIREDATPELKSLYQALRKAETAVSRSLTRLMESHRDIVMDTIVTRRSGRFVIPIRQDFKGRIQCIVHDTSASGATAYAEPIEIVDLNNRVQQIAGDIHRCELEILRRLTIAVRENRQFFLHINETIGYFDSMLARFRFSNTYDCTLPAPSTDDWTRFKAARHPLLLFQKHAVVPNDIELDPDRPMLIVSGSNTGGKTVFLKTCGLLQLMCQAVIPVPAGDASSFRIFSRILADIGDRQSIDESLSTFSGHMVRIREILETVDRESLVLIDELGTGTEPAEGAAIAVGVAEALRTRQVTTVITSHHQELSQLAHDGTGGIRLATVDFDEALLEPTYRLIYDIPGASHAIEIAKRIGLPGDVIKRANALAEASDAGKAAKLSVQLTRQLRDMQVKEAELDTELDEVRRQKDRQESVLTALREEKRHLEKQVRTEVETLMADFRKEKERVFHRVSAIHRQDADELESQLEANLNAVVNKRLDVPEEDTIQKLEAGDRIRHLVTGMEGEVVEVGRRGDRVCIRVRGKNMWVTPPDLEKLQQKKEQGKSGGIRLGRENLTPVQLECNIVGATVDDAVRKLEQELDKAVLAGVDLVRVIHGHGTGKLRKGIRSYLKGSPYVSSFEPDPNDGSTTVYLK